MRSIVQDMSLRPRQRSDNDSLLSTRHDKSVRCHADKGRQFACVPESPTSAQDARVLCKLNRQIYHGLHHAGIDYGKYQNTESITLAIDHGLSSLADALLRRTSRSRMLKNRSCEIGSPLIEAILNNDSDRACDMIARESIADTLDLSQPSALLCASAMGSKKIAHCLIQAKTRLHDRRQQKIKALVEQAKGSIMHDMHRGADLADTLARHVRPEKLDDADRDELAAAIHVAGKSGQFALQKALAKYYREAIKAAMSNSCWEADVMAFMTVARHARQMRQNRQAAQGRKPVLAGKQAGLLPVHCFVVQVDERLLYPHEGIAPLWMNNDLQRFLAGIQGQWKRIPDGQRFQLALQFESSMHWIACDFCKRAEGLDVFMLDPANSEHPLALLNMLLDHGCKEGMGTPRILTRYVFRHPDITILPSAGATTEDETRFTAVLSLSHLDWQADRALPGSAGEGDTSRHGHPPLGDSGFMDRLYDDNYYLGLQAALVKEARQFIDRLDDTELVDVYLDRANPSRMFNPVTPLPEAQPMSCSVS
jgi:hypothetical protein